MAELSALEQNFNITQPNRSFNDFTQLEQQLKKLDKKIDEAITRSVDYNLVMNKPQVNNNVLSGNKSSAELGIVEGLQLDIDENNNLTVTLKSGNQTVASATKNIPTASVIRNIYMDYSTNSIVIEFTNGQILQLPLQDLVSMMLPIHFSLLITNSWTQIVGTNNYEQDITSQINYILSQIPLYNKVEPVGTENPSGEGWYERNSLGQYILTEDTTVVEGKDYYERVYKTLQASNIFEITASPEMQDIIDVSECSRLTLVTSVENNIPILKVIAEDGHPNSQFSIDVVMNNVVDMTQGNLISNPLYNNYILQDEIDNLEGSKQDKIEDHIQPTPPTDNDFLSYLNGTYNKKWVFGNIWLWIKSKITQIYYPIGSVVLNMGTNPSTNYGGTWELLADGTKALYLDSVAGTTINEELPNIKFDMEGLRLRALSSYSTSGAISTQNITQAIGCSGSTNRAITQLHLNAHKYSSVYKDNGKVRAEGITICAWKRTA